MMITFSGICPLLFLESHSVFCNNVFLFISVTTSIGFPLTKNIPKSLFESSKPVTITPTLGKGKQKIWLKHR